MSSLDALDRKILKVLQKDGDISHSKLAEGVGASTASCWRRIKALEERGVLCAAVRLVNPETVDLSLDVLCQVRVKSQEPNSRDDFERFVDSHPEIVECFSMSGEWDYLLRVMVGSVGKYEHFLMRELLAHPAVATSASHFALKRIKYTTALPL
jgi:DNA-binding Lrp family transcriptional regulator